MQRTLFISVSFFTMFGAFPALAQTYPPTTAGLRALVADDAKILPPPYAARLRKQEADWENGIGVKCVLDGVGKKHCRPDARVLIETIQRHVFELDGYVFDDEEWSASFQLSPATLRELGGASPPVTLDQNIPHIVAPHDARSRAFNAGVTSYFNLLWRQLGGPPRTNPQSDQYSDFELDYSANHDALPSVISLSITLDHYTHGAAHGEGDTEDFNWSLALNRPITPADLFKSDSHWQLGVATAGVAAFASILQDSDFAHTPEDMEKSFADPHSWAILKSGLRIDTGSYEICPYTCGEPSATIPWSALKAYLKPGAVVQAY